MGPYLLFYPSVNGSAYKGNSPGVDYRKLSLDPTKYKSPNMPLPYPLPFPSGDKFLLCASSLSVLLSANKSQLLQPNTFWLHAALWPGALSSACCWIWDPVTLALACSDYPHCIAASEFIFQ